MLANYSASTSGLCFDKIEESILYYDRRTSATVPLPLEQYVRGAHHLYLKQVPSALTLRRAASRIAPTIRPILLEDGFRDLFTMSNSEETVKLPDPDSDEEAADDSDTEYGDDVPEVSNDKPDNYEDIWKILAGWAYSSQYMEDKPSVLVWPGGCHRLNGPLGPTLFGPECTTKNRSFLENVGSHNQKMYLLLNHTFWGHMAQMARKSRKTDTTEKHPLKVFSETLVRRISHLLRGKYDPLWTLSERTKYYKDATHCRNPKERTRRFLEMLKTVDGMFLQRFIAFPEEKWDWEKYDMFVLQAISILIGDEFFDGEMTPEGISHRTAYSELKAARKVFKLVSHQDEPLKHEAQLKDVPRWVRSFFLATWKKALRFNGHQRAFLAGTLCQTRGSGTPPSLVVLQSKEKFLRTVQEEPPQITQTEYNLLARSVDMALEKVPGHVFTGLATKARVTVTGSACWEETRKGGGTAQAILELMQQYDEIQIPVHHLDTGVITHHQWKSDFESVGEAIFHACLHKVLTTPLEELRQVHLTIVKEPGKARVVTKGLAALKIVLDTISKICSYPLKKGFRSSESGMGRSHHGWNLFKDMFSDELTETLFSVKERTEDVFADHLQAHIVWEDVFAGSTDYQEATDRLVHTVAKLFANRWARRCGIPPILVGIMNAICFEKRTVYFTGTGSLRCIGESVDETTDMRRITLKRGVLMGDPMTKVVLHFTNIVSREMGEGFATGKIFQGFSNGAECQESYRRILNDYQRGRMPP